MNMPDRTPGQIAYATYERMLLQRPPPDVHLLWRLMTDLEQRAWDAAAQAVLALKEETAHRTPLSPEGDAAAAGLCCPACGGRDLTRRDFDQSAPERVTRAWRCESCGATWRAVYTLTGYEGLCQVLDVLP